MLMCYSMIIVDNSPLYELFLKTIFTFHLIYYFVYFLLILNMIVVACVMLKTGIFCHEYRSKIKIFLDLLIIMNSSC